MHPKLQKGQKAQRLCIYIGESDRWRGKPLYAALLEVLKTEGIAGATVIRGVAGFGAHSRIHSAAILRISEDLPLRIEIVDSADKINQAIEKVSVMVGEGLITLEEVQVIRYTHRYLNPLPADKPVGEVMTPNPLSIEAETTVAGAWEKMLTHFTKALPVVNTKNEPVGMLTDEDLLKRCSDILQRLSVSKRLDRSILEEQLRRLRESTLKVADVMSQPVIIAHESEPLGVAANRMAKAEIKRMPVTDKQGNLVGVLSRLDVLRQLSDTELGPRHPNVDVSSARTIGEVMSPDIPTVSASDGLADVVAAFLEYHSHRLIVIDENGKAIGLISDSDVVTRIQPRERRGILNALQRKAPIPPSSKIAEEIMSRGVLSAPSETPVVEAAQKMLSEGRKWLVVIDEHDHPIGLVDRQILFYSILG